MRWWMLGVLVACDDGTEAVDQGADAAPGSTPDAALDGSPEAAPDAERPDMAALPSACEDFRPCGGELSGAWAWQGWCQDFSADSPCPEADLTTAFVPAGQATFEAGGRFRMEATYTITRTFTAAPTCLADTACADWQPEGDPQWQCTGEVPCRCERVQVLPASQAGTWRIEGTQVVVQEDGMAPRALWYCVEGDRLRLRDVDAEAGQAVFDLRRP